jgi:hypothetical protein
MIRIPKIGSAWNFFSSAKHKQHKRARIARSRRFAFAEALERRDMMAAAVLQVTVENLAPTNGLHVTPFWVGFHNGNFGVATKGQSAAAFPGLESIAETGNTAGLVSRFTSDSTGSQSVITAPGGFAGAPVFEPGEIVSKLVTIGDTATSRYFSYASMIIPSNDAFIANLDPKEYQLFDATGQFIGARTIEIYGDEIWDAGTEVNNTKGGAAFSTLGGTSVDENGVIHAHAGLDDFIGTGLASGVNLASAFVHQTPIARITLSLASNPSGPIDSSPPLVTSSASSLTARKDFHEVTVTYSDASGIDPTSIGIDDISVTSPSLLQMKILSVTTDAVAGTTPRTVKAVYRFAPLSGSFTAIDNGTYVVNLNPSAVQDVFAHQTSQTHLAGFDVAIPVRLQITIENLAPIGGLGETPFWVAAHDGNFEIGKAGQRASGFSGLEELAETGATGAIASRFKTSSPNGFDKTITAPGGFAGAPIFEPGELVTSTLDISDPSFNRYFSYASMVIPSNDAFIANLDPRGIELFNRAGQFLGARTLTIYGNQVWDAGTEVNNPTGGAAFTTGGGTSVDENGVIHKHEGLNNFIGATLPTGSKLLSAFGSMTPLARITLSLVDNPANAIDDDGPAHTLDAPNVDSAATAATDITVTYSDPSGVDLTTIGVNDIDVVGAFVTPLKVLSVTTDATAGTSPKSVRATYRVAPESGPFSTFNNSVYQVNLREGAVADSLGNKSEAGNLGQFTVLVGVRLNVTIENLSAPGGLSQTPFWIGLHDGNFEVARSGVGASGFAGLEAIAETGNTSALVTRFHASSKGVDTVVTAPLGFAGAPVFEPGEKSSKVIEVYDTNINRFFSYASMIIPSNDAFVANLNSREYSLFDLGGRFAGARTITIYGNEILDAGTEVNNPTGGAAFSTGGGTAVDENGVVRSHPGLDNFIGTGLPTGSNLRSAFRNQTPIARITISLDSDPSGPIDTDGPGASATAETVSTPGATTHLVRVTYSDPSGIDSTRFGIDDVRVEGPLQSKLTVSSFKVIPGEGAIPKTAIVEYTVAPASGSFTARDNGLYFVSLNANSVGDTLGHSSAAQEIGSFHVDLGIRLEVTIENLAIPGGVSDTPFWLGFHDGNFEVARAGVSASQFPGLELIAETGNASELVTRFGATNKGINTVVTAPSGFAGAPVFEPGEKVTKLIEIRDTNINQFFSYASMIVPSNDAFVANIDPRQFRLFDNNGNFAGEREITIYGRHVWDAGTEVNNPAGGAAFSSGGGVGVDENGVVHKHPGLNNFVGTGQVTGSNLLSAFDDNTVLARIKVRLFDPPATACSGLLGACSVSSVSLQNRPLALDVDNDGSVTPLDALVIVNFLNQFGNQSSFSEEARALNYFLDTNDDSTVAPLDVLLVINYLNTLGNLGGGEGEASAAPLHSNSANDSTSATDSVFASFAFDLNPLRRKES